MLQGNLLVAGIHAVAITLEETTNYRFIPKILHSYSQVIHMEEFSLENAAPPIVLN